MEDFFDVAEHPQVRFEVVGRCSEQEERVHVSGTLTAAGTAFQVPSSVRLIDGELEVEATTTVDQSRLGMSRGPLGNVRPPAKLHVKARVLREPSE